MSKVTTHILDTAHGMPAVGVPVTLRDADEHLHVPPLLSAFGYSTYRGS